MKLTLERIAVHELCRDWEHAVEKLGELFVKTGATTKEYTAAMIECAKTYGPYIVVDEGIALPHARPECGVLEDALAVLTLEQPVSFGNEVNDPVWVLIGFAAKSDDDHIDALRELADFIDRPAFVSDLRRLTTPKEVLAFWQRKEETC